MRQDPCGSNALGISDYFPYGVDFLTCTFILRAFLSPVINHMYGQNVCG